MRRTALKRTRESALPGLADGAAWLSNPEQKQVIEFARKSRQAGLDA